MFYLILIILLVILVVGPSYWVKHIMEKYSQPHDRYVCTGAELARTLLDRANLQQVKIETTELGDHYDPQAKVVRLDLCFRFAYDITQYRALVGDYSKVAIEWK